MNTEPSPRPWQVSDGFLDRYSTGHRDIVDARGELVAVRVSSADAALIVDAVNERALLRDIVRRMEDNLARYHLIGERDRALLREARSALEEGGRS